MCFIRKSHCSVLAWQPGLSQRNLAADGILFYKWLFLIGHNTICCVCLGRMRLIDEILSSPDSSCFYPNNRYFYAIGNTLSADLTEGCRVPSDAKFLLLACGDIRNILYTVQEVSQLQPTPKSLTFHINDIDDVLLARNTVLLHAVKNVDPDNRKDVDFLWNIWYNLALSEADSTRLKEIFTDILQNPDDCVKFETEECSVAVKKIVKYWLKSTTPLKKIKKEREKLMRKKVDIDTKSSRGVSFEDCIDNLYISCDCMPGLDSTLAAKNQVDDIKAYFRTGSTDKGPGRDFTNPTFLCPDVESQWRVHPQSLPYCVFNSVL